MTDPTTPIHPQPTGSAGATTSRRRATTAFVGGLAIAAGALGGAATWLGRSSPAEAVVPSEVVGFPGNAGSADEAPLVLSATNVLARLGGGEAPLVLDVSPPRVYEVGHLPGAVHAWWQDTMDPHYPVYGVVLKNHRDEPRYTHASVLARFGVTPDRDVVLYDADRGRYAARLLWYLRFLGFPRSSVLEGGPAAWRGVGGDLDTTGHDAPRVERPRARARSGFLIGTQELSERLGDPSLVVLDCRTERESRDDLHGRIRRGRIPDSVRLPWPSILRDEAGRFGSAADLEALFRSLGATPDREIAVVARFGVESGPTWLALSLLGHPSVRVYDQGWAEWAGKPELPIEPLDGDVDG